MCIPMTMNLCPKCRQENPPKANFCNHCGASLNTSDAEDQLQVSYNKKKSKRLAERRQLTILFCDLVGSTPLSERLDPEEFREVITNYHQEAEKVVVQNGGYIAQYLGDGLLVYFGYPEGLEDAAIVGVKTGLGILDAIDKANQQWGAIGKTKIKIRIGIHTGLVVVDDHLALGETVNVAARLEGLAPHNGMVISPQTNKLIHGWFEIKSIGKQILKGISEPMEIFEVLQESGVKTRLEIAKSRGLSPLVGREKELDQLSKYWEKAKNGSGSLLLLNGEAGIGKSRLLDTIEQQIIQDPDTCLLVARCSAYQKNSAFHPIIQLLEIAILQIEEGDGPKDKLAKLERFLHQTSLDFESAVSLFAEFLSIPSKQYPPHIMSPFAKRQKIMDGITQVLLHKTNRQPVLFVLEDLHWADPSTLEWLKLFIDQLSPHSIFVLCTTRPIFNPDWIEHQSVSQLTLQRLSIDNMVDICHFQSKGKMLPKEILKHIATKTEGVPLFVEELTKMIIESEFLVENANAYETVGSFSALTIPSTLQDSLMARLDRLSDEKEIVQIGSVLGREFSLEMLHAVIPNKEVSMELSLSHLLKAGIFDFRERGKKSVYQFKHALIQDAAYESLLKSRRQQLHNQVAEVLEHQFKDISQTQPELLADHYTEAGKPLQAIPIWLKAGQLASHQNATTEAIAHLEKGLELLNYIDNDSERNKLELEFRLTLGGTYVVSHGFPHTKVKETFNRARDIAQTIEVNPKLALILFNLLSYYFNTEDYEAHSEVADYMMKLARDPDHGYWFELCASQLVGGAGVIKGEFEMANRSYQRVLELFDPSLPFPWELAPSGYIEIGAKAWQMVCLQILGKMDQAKKLSEKHLPYAKDHKDSMTLYHIFTFPALYNLEARQWRACEKILEEYLPIVRAFGDPIFNLTSDVYYNIAKAYQGDKHAFDVAIQLINVCFEVGFKAFAVTMSPYIGEQYYLKGDYKSALSWIEKIMDHVNETGSHIHTAELYRIKALTQQGMGKSDSMVEELFNQAFKLAKKQSAKTYELRAALELARMWQKQGKINDAFNILQETYNKFTEGFDSVDMKEGRGFLEELKTG